MPAPVTLEDFLAIVGKSRLLDPSALATYLQHRRGAPTPLTGPRDLAEALVHDGLLTPFQAEQLLLGRWRNFVLSGKYKVLDHLGAGGMGSVFLCEHLVMRRRVALKVLPAGQARDPGALERFRREARAIACLSHPNIVTAYDTDRDGDLHFLVMEYIDGSSLAEVVRARGPLDPLRAAHYVRQAALGLQHAHEAGLVHRDVKPSNLLLDRAGTVKVLDLGLARFFRDEGDDLTRARGSGTLGTARYMAPEQAENSHAVDARADVYSLGATFYFLLTGRSPSQEGTAERWQAPFPRQPPPVRDVRPDVPEGLASVVDRMLASAPAERYQSAAEVAGALLPWVQTPVTPPAAEDLLRPGPVREAGETESALGPLTPLTGTATVPLPTSSTARRGADAPRLPPPSGPAEAVAAPPGPEGHTPPRRPPGGRRWVGVAVAGAAATLLAGGLLGLLAYTATRAKVQPTEAAPSAGRPAGEGTTGPALRLLVPAYFYPGGEGLRQWDRLIDSAGIAPVVAIANVDNGPGKAAEPNYIAVIDRARKAGVTVIGYVSTDYAKRPLAEAKADVARWARFYPPVQGVFLDQQASGAEHVDYYASLYQHARQELPGALVVTNPGMICAEEYLARPAADVACLAEVPRDFSAYRPPSWADRYPASRFAALIHGTDAPEKMKSQIRQIAEGNVGYGYVTNGKGANPWERLPPYWEAEAAAVRRLNERKAP
jgi:serine/threonine protein kinase